MPTQALAELKVLCWMLSTKVPSRDKNDLPEPYRSHLSTVVDEVLDAGASHDAVPWAPDEPNRSSGHTGDPGWEPFASSAGQIDVVADLLSEQVADDIEAGTGSRLRESERVLIGLVVMKTMTRLTMESVSMGTGHLLAAVIRAFADNVPSGGEEQE
ncbi:hypothetical protein GCG21_08530 [Pseudactinotalea sp. HY160]|uniref:hypothetical protein n=1 Tax=Pseudactinotalea sp. HY160 TaxID=2654490 RepID=UPI00128E09F5|nr:hypothetical protein [Pseudactinotalea sp. HY160]MPV50049.1 hypothetical protein [Pseudactinotalea sp. HY160]